MAAIFVDTSGWACWLIGSERLNGLARQITNEAVKNGEPLVTTSFVLVELTALLTSPIHYPKQKQIEFITDIYGDPAISVVSIDSALEAEAWELWRQRPDKDWTLTDCASFAVMGQLKIGRALTTDHHFEQAGFVRLLK